MSERQNRISFKPVLWSVPLVDATVVVDGGNDDGAGLVTLLLSLRLLSGFGGPERSGQVRQGPGRWVWDHAGYEQEDSINNEETLQCLFT